MSLARLAASSSASASTLARRASSDHASSSSDRHVADPALRARRPVSTPRALAPRRSARAHASHARPPRALAPDVAVTASPDPNPVDLVDPVDAYGSFASASSAAPVASIALDASATGPDPSAPATFEPRADPAPAFASLAILLAFAVVNRRVAAAVDRRKDREDAEETLRQARLRSLDGSADFDEVSEAYDALERARDEEAAAREVLAFFGADVRVRMPQPLGKSVAKVEEEEARVADVIRRRREAREGKGADRDADQGAESRGDAPADGPPWWMTAAVAFCLLILTWSAAGLMFSPDPAAGPALSPEQVEQQMAMRGYY